MADIPAACGDTGRKKTFCIRRIQNQRSLQRGGTVKEYQATLLLDAGCALGEGPVYDETRDGLYWLDIEKNRIHYLDFASGRSLYLQLDRPIGSMVLTDRGRILAGMDDGVYMIEDLRITPYCLMAEAADEAIRFNDGKCDPAGRFVVGTQVTPNDAELGNLFSVSGKDTYRILNPGLGCSNGLAWTADGKTLYHVDTLVKVPSRIYAFDYDPETGAATNRREVIDYTPLAEKGCLADGMTIDRDGNLWLADWGGYGISCWDPRTGERIARVSVPAEKVSCCAFGGKDYKTLYITTAAGNGAYAGGIFTAETGAAGYPPVRFREEAEND